jgi:hypothetical protein
MPSVQDCAERLREQAYRTLLPQVRDLEQELKGVSGSLVAGLEQIERKLESLRKIELPTADLVLNEILENLIQQKDMEANALVLFMRGLRRKETQEEILSFLLDGINQFYPRVALFAVRGGRFIGWSSRGFSETAAGNISACSFSCSENPQLEAALEGEEPTAISELAEDSPLQFLREDGTGSWNLLPLKTLQRPVALLLTGGTSNRPDAAAIMIGLAAFRLENIALKILHDLSVEQPKAVPQPAANETAVEEPPVKPEPEPAIAAEEPAASQVPPEEPGPATESTLVLEPASLQPADMEPRQEPAPETDVPIMKAVEEPPAVEIPTEAPAPAPAPVPLPEAMITREPEAKPIPEEERLHTEAKRFARLLVSEIKLYNEHHVVEGRSNRDLYLRLKRDIDRSREMYEKRVSPIVSRKIDYFHDEIIRILGDNDPSTLGSDYPGPRVES